MSGSLATRHGQRRMLSPRGRLLAMLVAGGALTTPTAATAATVTAAPATQDVVSEVAFPVAISGVADGPSTLTVGWAALEDGCYSPVASDDVLSDLPVSGSFAVEQPGLVEAPGERLLCAFLRDARRTTVAASVVPFTARAPRTDFVVTAPAVAALGRPVRIRVVGSSEAPRSVFGKLAAPGTRCLEAVSSGSVFMSLKSAATSIDQIEEVTFDRYGLWHACVQTERYWTALDPTDRISEAPIRVTVRCTAASRELSRARDRWRAMSRRLRLRGLPPSPQLRIRGMAVRSARAWVEQACAPRT